MRVSHTAHGQERLDPNMSPGFKLLTCEKQIKKSRIPEFVKKKKYKKGKFSILNEQVKKIKDLFPISNQIYKHKHKETLDKKPNLSEKTNNF